MDNKGTETARDLNAKLDTARDSDAITNAFKQMTVAEKGPEPVAMPSARVDLASQLNQAQQSPPSVDTSAILGKSQFQRPEGPAAPPQMMSNVIDQPLRSASNLDPALQSQVIKTTEDMLKRATGVHEVSAGTNLDTDEHSKPQ